MRKALGYENAFKVSERVVERRVLTKSGHFITKACPFKSYVDERMAERTGKTRRQVTYSCYVYFSSFLLCLPSHILVLGEYQNLAAWCQAGSKPKVKVHLSPNSSTSRLTAPTYAFASRLFTPPSITQHTPIKEAEAMLDFRDYDESPRRFRHRVVPKTL